MIEVWRLRAMTIIDKIKDTILKFIGGAYDPLQFSYDLPNLIVDN